MVIALVLALVGKVVFQLQPQQPGLRADNVIFVRVVTGRPIVHTNADLLFRCPLGLVVQGAAAYVEEESSQPGRPFKGAAGSDAVYQFLSLCRSLRRSFLATRHRYIC